MMLHFWVIYYCKNSHNSYLFLDDKIVLEGNISRVGGGKETDIVLFCFFSIMALLRKLYPFYLCNMISTFLIHLQDSLAGQLASFIFN
jgi:hypothetical protein